MAAAKTVHNKGKGEGIAFLRANVGYAGDDCLIWPMSRDDKGYAILGLNGKVRKAARVMCELVKGPPPKPKHEAAHSCGRGKDACVHPMHLSWKTRTENQRDRREHGTAGKGRWGHLRHRLTPEQVAEIRAIGAGQTKKALGIAFGVTPSLIAKILNGERWRTGEREFGGFKPGDPRNPSVRKLRI